jgi:hypothetical protein
MQKKHCTEFNTLCHQKNKTQYLFTIKEKRASRPGTDNKGHTWTAQSYTLAQWWHAKSFPLRSGTRQGRLCSPLLVNTVLEVPTEQLGKKEKWWVPKLERKKYKLPTSPDDMIICGEVAKECTLPRAHTHTHTHTHTHACWNKQGSSCSKLNQHPKFICGPDTVTHACNPNYSRGIHQNDTVQDKTRQRSSQDWIFNKSWRWCKPVIPAT